MNSYTLEKGRQRAEGRRQKGKKSLKGEGFFITDYPDMILRKVVDNTLSVEGECHL
ncbi:MAG: hypothetical protein F6K39_35320 [Okeania sp. SIO3B3]|nr:hypothetical protein [Okeania sp. SIO3B3]